MGGLAGVVDLLYEATLDTDLWPGVVLEIADLVGGAGAALLAAGRPDGVWVRVDPHAKALFDTRFIASNPVFEFISEARRAPGYRPMITTDQDIAAAADLRRTAYYNEFMRPYDGASTLVFDFDLPGLSGALNIGRSHRQGSFGEGDLRLAQALHPHLVRAFWLSMRLGARSHLGDDLLGVLDTSDLGVILIDGAGRVMHANATAEAQLTGREALGLLAGRICATGPSAGALSALIDRAITADRAARRGGSLAVRRPNAGAPLTVTITPLGAARQRLFDVHPAALVCIHDPAAQPPPTEDRLMDLFGLTKAEARVAVKLLEGLDQRQAAEALGVSFFTVRTHLSHIFHKTDVNRQSDLVRLMMRAVGANPPWVDPR